MAGVAGVPKARSAVGGEIWALSSLADQNMQGIMGVWALPLKEVRLDLSLNSKRKTGQDYRSKAESLNNKAAMETQGRRGTV